MYRFSGEHECKIDEKGRLTLPARIKSALPEETTVGFVLSRGFEPCLVLYTAEEWELIFNKVAGMDPFNAEHRNFQRAFLRGYTEVEMDKAGRILLPRLMMKFAQLDRDSVLFGVGNRIEIWNPELYESYFGMDPAELSEKAEKFLGKRSGMDEKPVIVNINRGASLSEASHQSESNSGG